MIAERGEIYFDKCHVKELKGAPSYVKERYRAIVATLSNIGRCTRAQAAALAGLSLRHFQRVLRRFQEEGIAGLYKNSPNKTPDEIEDVVIKVRQETGFGSVDIAMLTNTILELDGIDRKMNKTTVYNILVRKREIQAEKRRQAEYKFFEWGHPNRLIQSDLTEFNGIPILTCIDDHARKSWNSRVTDEHDRTVVAKMEEMLPDKYDNLLTDNGPQFRRSNSMMRKYCDEHLNENHIWSSPHHPQTLGKLSAHQKNMKRFLIHRLGRSQDKKAIDEMVEIYSDFANNCRVNSRTKCIPEQRYSGNIDKTSVLWFLEKLKLLQRFPCKAGG